MKLSGSFFSIRNISMPLGMLLAFYLFSLAKPVELNAAPAPASLIQTIDTSRLTPPSPDPAGLCYLNFSDTFLISDSEVNEMPIFTGDNLFEISPSGILTSTMTTLPFSFEPTGVTLNTNNNHLFFTDDNEGFIIEVNPGPDGSYFTGDDSVTYSDTFLFNCTDPEGITFDSLQGDLYVACGLDALVSRVSPGVNGFFDGAPPVGDDEVTNFDTASLGVIDLEGITYDSDNGLLYIVGEPGDLLAHITTDGKLVRMIDISVINAIDPAGLAYAPSSIDPSVMSIYLSDRGIDNNDDPSENDGKFHELSIPLISEGNLMPYVFAGPDQAIIFPDDALLDAIASDDGLPYPPQLIITWSVMSGPGTVTFSDAGALKTTVGFSEPGAYVLRLTAADGEFESTDELNIFVSHLAYTPAADTFVDKANPGTNFGSAPDLEISALGDGSPQETAYLQFDVVGLAGPVQSAKVRLEVSNAGVFGGSIHSVPDNSWGEYTLDFNSKPPHESQSLDALGKVNAGDTVLFDVTEAISGEGTYSFAISGVNPACTGGSDGSMGESGDLGTYASNLTGEKVYFSPFIPANSGMVSYIHFEEFSADGPLRAGVYDQLGNLLASSVELRGNNSNPGMEMHAALDQAICLTSGQTYYLALWVGKDGWAGTAYGGPGGGTYYVSDVPSFPASLSLPGNTQSGSTSMRITVNNSPDSFAGGTAAVAAYRSREYLNNPPMLIINPVPIGIPSAVNDAFSMDENTTLSGSVITNDSPGDVPITVSELVGVNNGLLTLNDDGIFSYTPNADFNGTDSFIYRLTDADNESSDGTVTITVTAVNSGVPVAVDDPAAAVTPEDTPVTTINVLLNDTLADNAVISAFDAISVNGGVVVYNGDGTFTYTPALGFNGTDSFTYLLIDDDGESGTAAVAVTVTAVNSGVPVAVDDPAAATTADGIAVTTIDVLLNDTLVDNAVISAFDAISVNGGAVVNNGDGTFTYTPTSGFTGTDSFTYTLTDDDGESGTATVTVTVTSVNSGAPVAVDDPAAGTTLEGTPLTTIDVLLNDTLVDNAVISAFDAISVNGGAVVNNGDGTFTYMPVSGFTGTDSFTYTLTDDDGESATATVTVTVTLPVLCDGGSNGSMGDSRDPETYAANRRGEKVYFSPYTPDVSGRVSYIHFEEFSAGSPIRAGIYDHLGNLLASSAELMGNNSKPGMEVHAALDQTVCLASGQTYYLALWVGKDAWAGTAYGGPGGGTFYNSDVLSFPSSLLLPGNQQSGYTSIRITVNNKPNAFDPGIPVAVNDAFTISENTTLSGSVITNDSPGDVPITVSELVGVNNGLLTLNGDGAFSYTPNAGFNGTDSFIYRLTDADNESSDATVTITVTAVNSGTPVAVDDPAAGTTTEDTPVTTINVLLNDTLIDNAVISAFEDVSASGGTVVNNGDGTFTYTPASGFNGTDSFIYVLTDDDGESSMAAVAVTVISVNSGAPVAVDDPAAGTTPEGTPLTTINVFLNDTLVDNAVISAFDAISVNGGTVVNNGDGTFTYTPASGFSGTDSFTYTLTDDDGESGTATVTVTVTLPVSCVGGSNGSMGDSTDPGTYAANSTGEKVYFSQFIPVNGGRVTYIHFEEFSAGGPVRAGIYDHLGNLLASSAELAGNNSNPGMEMHAALDQDVCLVSGETYYLALWVGNDAWAGAAYGGPGGGTYYNSDVPAFPSSLALPGNKQSGSTSVRMTVNNSADAF
ncbi:MAG: tandem-95 repeat protein [Deltaproteobacteria bacterium]|nr:tandem-95 repeat protein [Deltaproteobacteria bacterium]